MSAANTLSRAVGSVLSGLRQTLWASGEAQRSGRPVCEQLENRVMLYMAVYFDGVHYWCYLVQSASQYSNNPVPCVNGSQQAQSNGNSAVTGGVTGASTGVGNQATSAAASQGLSMVTIGGLKSHAAANAIPTLEGQIANFEQTIQNVVDAGQNPGDLYTELHNAESQLAPNGFLPTEC